jgi:hypothetical protein
MSVSQFCARSPSPRGASGGVHGETGSPPSIGVASLHRCPGWLTKPLRDPYTVILRELTRCRESEDNNAGPNDPPTAKELEAITTWLAGQTLCLKTVFGLFLCRLVDQPLLLLAVRGTWIARHLGHIWGHPQLPEQHSPISSS